MAKSLSIQRRKEMNNCETCVYKIEHNKRVKEAKEIERCLKDTRKIIELTEKLKDKYSGGQI